MRRLGTLPLAAACLMMAASASDAQVTPANLASATLEDLMKVTITTASRQAEQATDAPARVHVVTSVQIERRGYQSLAELLQDLPDFLVDLGADPDFPAELTVQGVRGAGRVVVLLDGTRVSSPTNEPLPILANYPVHMARQVEIVYGPASALYGADAFSAIVNIVTKTGEASGLAVSASAGQHGRFNETASYGRRFANGSSLLVAGQFHYDRGPDLTRYYPGDFGQLNAQRSGTFNTIYGPMSVVGLPAQEFENPISARSMYARYRAGGLQVSLFESRVRTPTSAPYTPENAVYDAAAFNQNELLVGAASFTRPVGPIASATGLTLSRHELDPHSGYWNIYSNLKRSYKYAYGSMIKLDQQLSWRSSDALTLTTGGTIERFYAIPQGADLNAPIGSHDRPGTILDTTITDEFVKVRSANVGTYAQAQYVPNPVVTFTLGARGDYNTRYGGSFNPRVGVVAHPWPATTVKVLYGRAFLAPSPYHSYAHYGSFYTTDGGATYASNYWHVGNPDLKPETKRTIEAGIVQMLGPHFVVSASGFHSRITNLRKASDPHQARSGLYLGWPVAYIDFPVNEGHQTTYGGAVEINYVQAYGRNRHLEARLGLSAVDGSIWEGHGHDHLLPIGGMAPLQLRAGVDVAWGRWSAAPRIMAVSRQRVLATVEAEEGEVRRTIDGFCRIDLNVRRRRVLGNVDAFVKIDNLLDRRYRAINTRAYTNPEELIGAPQDPRRVTVGIDLRFSSRRLARSRRRGE